MNEQSIKIYDLMNKIKKEISLKQEYIASELERATTKRERKTNETKEQESKC